MHFQILQSLANLQTSLQNIFLKKRAWPYYQAQRLVSMAKVICAFRMLILWKTSPRLWKKLQWLSKSSPKMANKILITGATGFVGSHLARALVKSDEDVHLFIRTNSDLW